MTKSSEQGVVNADTVSDLLTTMENLLKINAGLLEQINGLLQLITEKDNAISSQNRSLLEQSVKLIVMESFIKTYEHWSDYEHFVSKTNDLWKLQ